jgi:glycosyltransferase involved in cell wall biosynthesis
MARKAKRALLDHSDDGKAPWPQDAWTDEGYERWLAAHRPSEEELARQRTTVFDGAPTFSIVVPLYRTPLDYLSDMIDSVLAQTYPAFELILVNASPEISELAAAVSAYAGRDARIRPITLDANYGITENTKRGIAEATGDFVCFLDHDDFLEPDLLFEYAKAVVGDPEIDILYCDEDLVEKGKGGFVHRNPQFKPAYAPEVLLCKNLVVHLLCIRRTLVRDDDGFGPRFDGAQDHELLLWAARSARKIHGVQKVLYHWRISATSTSANAQAKPFSEWAARLVIGEELAVRGLDAKVFADPLPNLYRLWHSPSSARVSVIVRCASADRDPLYYLQVFQQTNSYDNVEFVLVVPQGRTLGELPDGLDVKVAEAERFESPFCCLNAGAAVAGGDYLLLLDDGCLFLTPEPIEQLVGMCAAEGVVACAPKTLYQDGLNRCYGIGITAERIMPLYRGYPDEFPGYECSLRVMQDTSAASWRGMLVDRGAFAEAGGFDEAFASEVGSADLCVRLRSDGRRVVQMPTVKLKTYESCPPDRFGDNAPDFPASDVMLFDQRHPGLRAAGDPYINRNLDQGSAYFQLPRPWSRAER